MQNVSFDINFEIKRDDQGLVTGFGLTSTETYAEAYCVSFVTSMQIRNRSQIHFADGKIIFRHGGVSMDEGDDRLGIYGISSGGEISFEVSDDDAQALKDLLNCSGPYTGRKFTARFELAWGKGFSINLLPK